MSTKKTDSKKEDKDILVAEFNNAKGRVNITSVKQLKDNTKLADILPEYVGKEKVTYVDTSKKTETPGSSYYYEVKIGPTKTDKNSYIKRFYSDGSYKMYRVYEYKTSDGKTRYDYVLQNYTKESTSSSNKKAVIEILDANTGKVTEEALVQSNSKYIYTQGSDKLKIITSPQPTLIRNGKTLKVTDTNGKQHVIKFPSGIPDKVSGVGDLTKSASSYTKEFTNSQILKLKEAATKAEKAAKQAEYEKRMNKVLTDAASKTRPLSKTGYDSAVYMPSSFKYKKTYANVKKLNTDSGSYGNFDTGYKTSKKNAAPSVESNDASAGGATSNGSTVTYSTKTGYTVKPSIAPLGNSALEKLQKPVTYGDYDILYNSVKNGVQDKIHQSVGLLEFTETEYLKRSATQYNRFKMLAPDTLLQRSFGHVFFVRPACNIAKSNKTMTDQFKNDPTFLYTWLHSPEVLRELSANTSNTDTDFSYLLSNAAGSFSLSDEYIKTDNYGTGYSGYEISFGRHDIESKTAGDFSVVFNEDKDFTIYKLIRHWTQYISMCYRGRAVPEDNTILNKELDYAGAAYYILTAEDGETILFWSKYYGVFPTTIPSSQYSWAHGNTLQAPTLDITFKYSFKEDFDVNSLTEFNYNSHVSEVVEGGVLTYRPIYSSYLGNVGQTWVKRPFIETVSEDGKLTFKLRFV